VDALVFAARGVLALTLVYAALAKVYDARRLPGQLRAFGVTSALAIPVAVAIPAIELVIGVSLVAFPYSTVPAFAAVGLLALFTGAVLANMVRENAAPCPCFGAVAVERPVSGRTLFRNAWLLALAIIATGDPTGDSSALTLPLFLVLGLVTLFVVRATS
jgi:hypothetical protein